MRTARLTLRCAAVRLQPPKARTSYLGELDAFAICAIEEAPPQGTQPLEWMLLSSVPTTSLDEVLERLAWYARRWTIESWHRVLKSGCRIEARQFGSLERFVRATACSPSSVGASCMQLCWHESTPICLAKYCCNPSNGMALYCHTHHTRYRPKKTPPLQQAVLWIAMLGGYLNRKHDRPPGPTDEISTAKRVKSSKRPNFADEFKRALVKQTFEPDASVSQVARRNDFNTNLLFRWCRQYLEGAFGLTRPEQVDHQKPTDCILTLLPVSIVDEPSVAASARQPRKARHLQKVYARSNLNGHGFVCAAMYRRQR